MWEIPISHVCIRSSKKKKPYGYVPRKNNTDLYPVQKQRNILNSLGEDIPEMCLLIGLDF